jgi:hypothetical protein
LIIAAAAAAAADIPAVPAPQLAKPIVVEGNRKVCHEEVATGSILPKRVCKTVDQLEKEVAASQALAAQRAREQTTYQQMQFQIEQRKKNPR